MRLGIIARSDNTGLGNQTKELVDMLKPAKIMLINSQPFNKNVQHPEWYKSYDCQHVRGFPKLHDIQYFLKSLDVVLSCETFYNKDFVTMARKKNVKTVLQYNYEFFDNLQRPTLPLPDVLLSPSYWGLEAITEAFSDKAKVIYLPPPTDHNRFKKAVFENINNDHKKILHINGKSAHMDRNGTETVIKMLEYSKAEYKLVIKTQSELDIKTKDSRLSIETSNVDNREDMYCGFDAMVLPRRYAGLCLPMNEALLSGLPVFMTDISPNNRVLPKEWLIKSNKINEFMARTMIDVYEADPKELAKKIDKYINSDKTDAKNNALQIGINSFAVENLIDKYIDILK